MIRFVLEVWAEGQSAPLQQLHLEAQDLKDALGLAGAEFEGVRKLHPTARSLRLVPDRSRYWQRPAEEGFDDQWEEVD